MDKQRIDEIRKREQEATPGPWNVSGWIQAFGNHEITSPYVDHWIAEVQVVLNPQEEPGCHANAALIAHARQDIPDLLAALDTAQAELAAERENGRALREAISSIPIKHYAACNAHSEKIDCCSCNIKPIIKHLRTALASGVQGQAA